MEGWVDLGYLAMQRPGTELAISWSQVRRPNHYRTEPPSSSANDSQAVFNPTGESTRVVFFSLMVHRTNTKFRLMSRSLNAITDFKIPDYGPASRRLNAQ